MKPQFIIVWDDNQGLCVPMEWDNECKGAVTSYTFRGRIAIFEDKKAARRAINISAKWAQLQMAQGNSAANTDFIGASKAHLKVLPCSPSP